MTEELKLALTEFVAAVGIWSGNSFLNEKANRLAKLLEAEVMESDLLNGLANASAKIKAEIYSGQRP